MKVSSETETIPLATGVAKRVLHLTQIGEFLEAKEALGEYWPPTGNEMNVRLIVGQGAVASGIGELDLAADCFSRAHRLAGSNDSWSHRALIGLSIIAWKRGEVREARIWIDQVPPGSPFSFHALIQKATVEKGDPKRALAILAQAESLADKNPDALRGRFHNQRGIVLRSLADAIKNKARQKDADSYRLRAALEYEAAIYFFEQCKSHNQRQIVFINLIGLYLSGEKFQEAHKVADRVIRRFGQDAPHLGMALDQKANILIAERNYREASEVSARAVATLEATDRHGWLAESLITMGTALARAGKYQEARAQLDRAAALCEHIGDRDQADKARIAIIQEVPITCVEAFDLFLKSQSAFLEASRALIHRIEGETIRNVLEQHHGSTREAAQEFNLTRQGLEKKIVTLFPHLANKPKRIRRWKTKPR